MDLPTVWFLLIAALFVGYLVLEGFDFGVGILLPVLGRTDAQRRVLINTIGPVWDGNEVWLITAVGAMFAAFPHWYATVFSGFYLPLLAILSSLVVRGVAFEYRGKRPEPAWRARWDTAIIIGSLIPAVGWGVVLATIVRGVPLTADHEYAGDPGTLLHPYGLFAGVTTGVLFTAHGAAFLALKTTGDLRRRANRLARRIGPGAAALTVALLAWTMTRHGDPTATALGAAASIALVAGLAASRAHREGWAFTGTAAAIALTVSALFATLYPAVLPATDPAHSLTVHNASSSPYTLTVLTWVAVLFAPIVLSYQGWTYWVFRHRLGTDNIPDH